MPLPPAAGPNQRWSMDFIHDRLNDHRRFRCLTIVDEFSRQSLAITVDHSIGGAGVVSTSDRLHRPRPARHVRLATLENRN